MVDKRITSPETLKELAKAAGFRVFGDKIVAADEGNSGLATESLARVVKLAADSERKLLYSQILDILTGFGIVFDESEAYIEHTNEQGLLVRDTLNSYGELFCLINAVFEKGLETAREDCARLCESKIDAEREQRLEAESRAAADTPNELPLLRQWSDVRLFNQAHEQDAKLIRAPGVKSTG